MQTIYLVLSRTLVILALALSASNAYSAESAVQEDESHLRDRMTNQVLAAFNAKDFASLEYQSQEYCGKEGHSKSGLWLCTLFDAGVMTTLKIFSGPDATRDTRWAVLDDYLNQWRTLYPKSTSAQIATAELLLVHAWAIRGGGWADSVPESAWEPFHSYLEKAEAQLLLIKPTASSNPNWYVAMLRVANDHNWDRDHYQALLDEAVGRYPRYYQIYFDALNYFLPKWHGSTMDMEIFATLAALLTKSTDGDGMYARMYWYAAQSQYRHHDLMTKSLVDWKKMKSGFEDIIRQYPDDWNINHYALFACEAKDWDKTKELMARIGDRPLMMAWRNEVIFKQCQNLQPIESIPLSGITRIGR